MVEPVLALLQVQVEGARRDPVELLEPALSITPETLNAIDVSCAAHELVVAMIDSIMLTVANIYQAIITAPPVRVDDCSERDATANNGLQRGFLAVRHNLRVNASVTLEDAEDDGFTKGSSASFASDSASAEVALIYFDFAARKGRGALTLLSNALSDPEKDSSYATARQSSQLSGMTGRQIECKVAH